MEQNWRVCSWEHCSDQGNDVQALPVTEASQNWSMEESGKSTPTSSHLFDLPYHWCGSEFRVSPGVSHLSGLCNCKSSNDIAFFSLHSFTSCHDTQWAKKMGGGLQTICWRSCWYNVALANHLLLTRILLLLHFSWRRDRITNYLIIILSKKDHIKNQDCLFLFYLCIALYRILLLLYICIKYLYIYICTYTSKI